MGLPFDFGEENDKSATPVLSQASDGDFSASRLSFRECNCQINVVKAIEILKREAGSVCTSRYTNEYTKGEVPEKCLDSNILQDREEEAVLKNCSKLYWNISTSESQPDGVTLFEDVELSSEVEKGGEAEKLLKENQIEETQLEVTDLSLQVEGEKEDEKDNKNKKNESKKMLKDGISTDHQQQEQPNDEKMLTEVGDNDKDLCTGSAHSEMMQANITVPEANQNGVFSDHQQQEQPNDEKMLTEVGDNDKDLCTGSAHSEMMQANITVPEAQKDGIFSDHQQQEKNKNEKEKETDETSKDELLKKEPTKCLSDDPSYKVKTATKDTSSSGGEGTCPADQPRSGSGQMGVALPPLQNGVSMSKGDEDDDDDDDDGKKPRQTHLKRDHESEELKEKKKKKKEKQESQATTAGGDFDHSKMNPSTARGEGETGSQPGVSDELCSMVREPALPQPGDTSAEEIQTKRKNEKDEDQLYGSGHCTVPAVHQEELEQSARASLPMGEDSFGGASGTIDELQTGLEQLFLSENYRLGNPGPGGDNRPLQQYILDGTHSCPQRGKHMSPTQHNSEAVKRFYNDNEVRTQISVPHVQPPPSRQQTQPRGPPASTFKSPTSLDPQDAMRKALEGDLIIEGLEEGPSEGGAAGPDPESAMGVTGAPRVFYGKERDLEKLVERVVNHDCTGGFQEDQDGVFRCKEMVIKNGTYRDGRQFDKLMFLGRGTFGDVYLIRDKVTKVDFVSKRVPLEKFSPNEALNLSSLEHSHINRLQGVMRSGDMVYFFLEYHPSETLQKLIGREKVLGQGRALFIIKQLFEALDWLHGKRIVHKDIKPQNIMIDDLDHIRLIDFGASKRLEGDLILTLNLEGTECYMAPEIAKCELYNGKADCWSAYCTLICTISGDPPWWRRLKDIPVKIYIIASSPAPLQDIPSNADQRVKEFIEFGLVSDFRQRPSSAQVLENFPLDLVDELYNVRAIEEELTPPPEAPFGFPKDICNEQLTPCTPRGPQTDMFRTYQQSVAPDENDSLDITKFFDVDNAAQNPPKINLEETLRQLEGDEDMYGPGLDMSVPGLDINGPGLDINRPGLDINEPALDMYGPDHSMDGQALGTDEIDGAPAKDINHASPLLGVPELLSKSLSPFNSQAAHSFIQDQQGDKHDDSLELLENFPQELGASAVERSFSRTVYDSDETSGIPVNNGSTSNGASGGFGARVNKTSGFRSITDSCPSSCSSLKTSVTVLIENSDPIIMKGSSGFLVSDLARTAYSKSVPTPFTLVHHKNGLNLQLAETLHNGEFHLRAVTAPDTSEIWLWRVNEVGRISRR